MTGWHALVLKGTDAVLRTFVTGVAAGRGDKSGAVFGGDVAFEPESLGERLRELFGGSGHHVVFAPDPLASALAQAVQAHGAHLGIALERSRPVGSADFSFRVEAFSRELAQEVRAALITSLPSDVRVEALREDVEEHPEAKGPEPFAPLHAYAYRATGRITGALPGVLEVRRRATEWEVVAIGTLRVAGLADHA